jgi:His-Xaa-Ser system radical SAM maturase HxsC
MCPSPEFVRKHSDNADIDNLILIAKHIPEDAAHLTLTGGEPFMVGDRIFDFFEFLKCKFERTDFLVLTNARIFAVDKYAKRLRETIPNSLIVGIPLHGSNAEIHDAITQTKNSFEQTMIGIKRLLALKIRIELRIVVNKLNVTDLENIALLIAEEIPSIEYVSIMAMEMTGNAYVNREIVWIPYKESFAEVGNAVDVLLENGIDVKLYNFPLCTVKHKYWTLCERSISPNKIRYAKICDECKVKNVCGGIFAGTFNLERGELEAQL